MFTNKVIKGILRVYIIKMNFNASHYERTNNFHPILITYLLIFQPSIDYKYNIFDKFNYSFCIYSFFYVLLISKIN